MMPLLREPERLTRAAWAIAVLMLGALPGRAGAQANPATVFDSKTFARINQAALVFTGRVTKVHKGSVGYTDPPLFSDDLTFGEITILHGAKPAAATFVRSVVQKEEPEYPKEVTWLVAADRFGDDWVIDYIIAADEKLVALAKQAAGLPLGWSLERGRPISPWAALAEKVSPTDIPEFRGPVCARSSRPAWLAGDAIEVAVEQVPPERRHEFKNPYGDGKFKITVKNRRDKPAVVPALVTDGNLICWEDSLVVIVHGQPQLLPSAGKRRGLQPTTLQVGASVSKTIDVLALKAAWPRGGARVYFRFCLGEKSAIDFFYYSSDYHDSLRDAAVKKLQGHGKP